MNQPCLSVFLFAFLQILQCLAVGNVSTQSDVQNQQISLLAMNVDKTQSHEIHFDSNQMKQINQFSIEILFVSGRTIILFLFFP